MLYLSTRNTIDSYTAYRALHESFAPDGGQYVPFRLPAFAPESLADIRQQSTCETISQVLNHLFGLHLTAWDVECAVGKLPLKPEPVNQRLVFAEGWRNPEGSFRYLLTHLYSLMTGKTGIVPTGWAQIGIEIALLFGLYSSLETLPEQGLDIAVAAGDFADLTAVLYAKEMGLPINVISCACDENSAVWELLTKGEIHTASAPAYLESFIYKRFGAGEVQRYLSERTYAVDEEQLSAFNDSVFAAVVSEKRVDSIISGMYRANGYAIDPGTAFAYGALQDYRSHTGVNRDTLLLAKLRPALERL